MAHHKQLLIVLCILSTLLLSSCVPSPPPSIGSGSANIVKIAQYCVNDTVYATSADTWYNLSWDTYIADESTNNSYVLSDDNQSFTINNFSGVVRVQGCIHSFNDDANVQEETLFVRVCVNGNEARCLQSARGKSFRTKDIDTIMYAGTIAVSDGDNVTVQWRTTNTKIILKGHPTFDNPVSASVNFELMGQAS